MLGSLLATLGKLQQVEVDLHVRHAAQSVSLALAGKHARIVGSDELDVGTLGLLANVETVSHRSRVALDVDRGEPEASELIDDPGRRQPGERMTDPESIEALTHPAGDLNAASADVAGDDVVAVEAVVVRPGVEQQAGVAWAQLAFASLEEQLVVEA